MSSLLPVDARAVTLPVSPYARQNKLILAQKAQSWKENQADLSLVVHFMYVLFHHSSLHSCLFRFSSIPRSTFYCMSHYCAFACLVSPKRQIQKSMQENLFWGRFKFWTQKCQHQEFLYNPRFLFLPAPDEIWKKTDKV